MLMIDRNPKFLSEAPGHRDVVRSICSIPVGSTNGRRGSCEQFVHILEGSTTSKGIVAFQTLEKPESRRQRCRKIQRTANIEKGVVRRVDVKTANKETVHRSTKTLVPLLPETANEEEEPVVRRSPRMQREKNLITKALLIWLTATASASNVNALNVTTLKPGLNLFNHGAVEIREAEYALRVQTDVNITADIEILNHQALDFSNFCNLYKNNH
jgi:hypothetical protein